MLSVHSIIPAVHIECGQNQMLLKKIVYTKVIYYLSVSLNSNGKLY